MEIMSYREFKTKDATYVLGLMYHGRQENLDSALQNLENTLNSMEEEERKEKAKEVFQYHFKSRISGIDVDIFDKVDGLVVEIVEAGIIDLLRDYGEAFVKARKVSSICNTPEAEKKYSS